MKGRRFAAAVLTVTVAVYLLVIAWGLKRHDLRDFNAFGQHLQPGAWKVAVLSNLDSRPDAGLIREGKAIFDDTPRQIPGHVGGRLSCSSCHAEDGTAPFAAPMVGIASTFPAWNARAGRVISLKDRIQECFTRSENGSPLAYSGQEMLALVAYINWLSEPHMQERPFSGRGLIQIPQMSGDKVRGEAVYASQCAGCHGSDGQGASNQYPPVWGNQSYNDGAGIHGEQKMAAFVKENMPQNHKGDLSLQQAYDVAAFLRSKPRPAFNQAYARY